VTVDELLPKARVIAAYDVTRDQYLVRMDARAHDDVMTQCAASFPITNGRDIRERYLTERAKAASIVLTLLAEKGITDAGALTPLPEIPMYQTPNWARP
jgi:hypothetical protein